MSDEDKRIEGALRGLDQDLQGQLLEMLSDDGHEPDGPAADTSAVRQRTFDKLNLYSKAGSAKRDWSSAEPGSPVQNDDTEQPRHRADGTQRQPQDGGGPRGRRNGRHLVWRWAVGGAAAAVVVGALATAPGPVSAALQRWLSFVPGIGSVQSTGGNPVMVLQGPVHGTWMGQDVTVTGVMVSSGEVVVSLHFVGSALPPYLSFETAAGKLIHLNGGGGVGEVTPNGGVEWAGTYSASGDFSSLMDSASGGLKGAVIVGNGSTTRLPVALSPAKTATDLSQLGPTQTHNGVTLTAIATRYGSKAELTVVPQYKGPFHIWDLAPRVGSSSAPGLYVSDTQGHTYAVKQELMDGPSNQFTFTPQQGVTAYQVSIPQVDATYQGTATVTLPVPATGSETVDKTVNLAGFPMEFTKVERVHDSSASKLNLRMYVNLHPSPGAAREFHTFSLRGDSDGGFWGWRVDSKTTVMQWMEVSVKPNQHSITLHLADPKVYIRGPWTFDIKLPPTSTGATGQ